MSRGSFNDVVDKAYYSSEREIKSRVVLEYDLPQINYPPEGTDTLSITYINLEQSSFSNLDEVVDQNIVNSRNYGSFEKNHFKLDGSFYLPYKEEQEGTDINKGSNYVNKNMQSHNQPLELTLQVKNKYVADPVNGFTIVFDDNYPKNISISFIDDKDYFNGSGLVNNDFEVVNGSLVEKTETSIKLSATSNGCYAKTIPDLADTAETNKSYIEKFGTEVESGIAYHLYARKSNSRRTILWVYMFDENYELIDNIASISTGSSTINANFDIPSNGKYICYTFVANTGTTEFYDISIQRDDYLTIEIEDNDKSTIYFELENPIDFTKLSSETTTISIGADTWALDNAETIYRRRIRLKKILLGLVEEYNDTEILSMNIINQTKRFCEEVPESECEFTIGNYSGEFDLLNKKGKKRLLSKRTTIKPWIGINTENGVQYEAKGIYFLDSWKNNEDETVTLTGKSVISLIKNTTINQIGGAFNSETSGYYMDLMLGIGKLNWQKMGGIRFFISNLIEQTIKKTCEFNFTRDNFENNVYAGSWWINTRNTKSKTLLELIQKLAVAGGCYLYEGYDVESEFNEVYFGLSSGAPENGQEYISQIITLDDMVSEPVVTKIDKINKVKISQTNLSTSQSTEVPTYSPTKIEKILDYDYEIIPVFFDNPTLVKEEAEMTLNNEIARSDVYDSGNGDGSGLSYYQSNFYMMFLNTKLKKGQTYSKTINIASLSTSEVSVEFTNKEDSKTPDVVLEINNELLPFIQNAEMKDNCKKMADYYLDNATQYEVSFEFFGNARLRPAETIRVQTRYGYIDVWVEKTEFNYDGGLTCKVEGVSTGGLIDE